MAANNAGNIKDQGVSYCNGSGVFSGIDASTATFVLTSNGTGVAPSFQAVSSGLSLISVERVLTSSEVKNLHGTPITLVSAQCLYYELEI